MKQQHKEILSFILSVVYRNVHCSKLTLVTGLGCNNQTCKRKNCNKTLYLFLNSCTVSEVKRKSKEDEAHLNLLLDAVSSTQQIQQPYQM